MHAAVRAATAAHGPISLLFANAGIGPCGLFLEGCEKKSAAADAADAAGGASAVAAAAGGSSSKKKAAAASSAASAPPSYPSLPCPWQTTMAVNYGGVVSVLQAALPGMVSQGKGRVVVTGSMGETRKRKRKRKRERERVPLLHLAPTDDGGKENLKKLNFSQEASWAPRASRPTRRPSTRCVGSATACGSR